jgi:hypothetical protein
LLVFLISFSKRTTTLNFENADGSREEHSVRIEELNFILKRTDSGKKIARALEIYNDDNNMITNKEDTTTTSHME